jgi:hypothetical protein
MTATVTPVGGKPTPCRIVDIGAAGCRIRVTDTARFKGPVTLEHEGQTLSAQVVWAQGGMVGLWFPSVRDDEPEPGALRRMWNRLRGGLG